MKIVTGNTTSKAEQTLGRENTKFQTNPFRNRVEGLIRKLVRNGYEKPTNGLFLSRRSIITQKM